MKEKIIARLRALFPGVNLRTTRVDTIAANLKITEEADIDQALKDLDAIIPFAEIAKSDDYQHTKAQREKQEKENKEKADKEKADKEQADKEKEGQGKGKTGGDDVPEWAKALIENSKVQAETNKALADKLAAIESGKTFDSRKSIFETKLKDANPILKQVYLDNFDPSKFETDEAFNEFVTATEGKIAAAAQQLSDQGLGGTGRPFTPAGSGGSTKEASKEEVDRIFGAL